jgi:hypothetical protein
MRSWRNQVDAPARGAGGPRGLSRFKSGRAHNASSSKGGSNSIRGGVMAFLPRLWIAGPLVRVQLPEHMPAQWQRIASRLGTAGVGVRFSGQARADVAQRLAHHLAKVRVASSNLVICSHAVVAQR